MRIALVINPRASRVTPARRLAVERALSEHHDVSVLETRRRDHATDLAAHAVADGVDAVAVLGGDGTLNEVSNALVGTDVVLMALPGGGTNVFCRTIGLPDDPARAAALLTDPSVVAGTEGDGVRRIGVGRVVADGAARTFLFHTGVGWDAALVEVVESHGDLKRRLNHALFVYAGLRTFFAGYDRSDPHIAVEFDDATTVDGAFFALVMNSDPYTFVGNRPFTVDPTNDATRPFSVVALRSMGVRDFVEVMVDALRGEGLRPRPWLVLRRDVTELTVRRLTSAPYQVDGDHLGEADELRFTWVPDALTVAVPNLGTATTDGQDGQDR